MSPKTKDAKTTHRDNDVIDADEMSAADDRPLAAIDPKTGQKAKPPKPVSSMSDQEVLQRTGYGKFGPALLASSGDEEQAHGRELHERAKKIMKGTAGGTLGPAIVDPDYERKRTNAIHNTRDARIEKERRMAILEDVGEQSQTGLDTVEHGLPPSIDPDLQDYNPDDIDHPLNPWKYVTLSGAKTLANANGVHYNPRMKRLELIDHLRKNGVLPPPIEDPDESKTDDDEDDTE